MTILLGRYDERHVRGTRAAHKLGKWGSAAAQATSAEGKRLIRMELEATLEAMSAERSADNTNDLSASLRLDDAVADLGRCVIATAEMDVVPMERALRDKVRRSFAHFVVCLLLASFVCSSCLFRDCSPPCVRRRRRCSAQAGATPPRASVPRT